MLISKGEVDRKRCHENLILVIQGQFSWILPRSSAGDSWESCPGHPRAFPWESCPRHQWVISWESFPCHSRAISWKSIPSYPPGIHKKLFWKCLRRSLGSSFPEGICLVFLCSYHYRHSAHCFISFFSNDEERKRSRALHGPEKLCSHLLPRSPFNLEHQGPH